MNPKAKLFLVTRTDLPLGQQAVQLAHALVEFIEQWSEVYRVWYKTSNHLAILSVTDEVALKALLVEAKGRGLSCAAFYEPDRGNELTAIAIEPSSLAKRITRRLPLALLS